MIEPHQLGGYTVFDNALPYVAAGITIVSGVVGFFWARSGERNAVGGVGWAALTLLLIGGGVSVYQVHRQSERAREASAKATELNQALQRSQHVATAAVMTLVGGLDLTSPVDSGNFYFELPYEGERPARPPGFTGPFPALPEGASADFQFSISGIAFEHYRLTPAENGALRIQHVTEGANPRQPQVTLARHGEEFGFQPDGLGERGWSAGPELKSGTEGESVYVFALSFPATGQFRRLIWQLSSDRPFGRITLRMPGLSEADASRLTAAYERIEAHVVFHAPTQAEPEGRAEACESSYIRMPLVIRRAANPAPGNLAFEIRPGLRAFEPELCEGGP